MNRTAFVFWIVSGMTREEIDTCRTTFFPKGVVGQGHPLFTVVFLWLHEVFLRSAHACKEVDRCVLPVYPSSVWISVNPQWGKYLVQAFKHLQKCIYRNNTSHFEKHFVFDRNVWKQLNSDINLVCLQRELDQCWGYQPLRMRNTDMVSGASARSCGIAWSESVVH